ncbi:MAG: D-2-hydroxyacid dehydrogenase [Firmicutes bacterium]|nr:D-2-hydroxyacid dehydrogenase [Bacillota bacterium]
MVTTYLPAALEDEFFSALARARFPGIIVPWRSLAPEDRPRVTILVGWHVPQAVIDALPNLAWIQAAGAGVDWTLDLSWRKTIVLTRMVDVFGPEMAEYALAATLAWVKDWPRLWALNQQHRWDPYPVRMLASLTVGILGAGSIGQAVIRLFHPLVKEVRAMGRRQPRLAGIAGYAASDAASFYQGLDALIVVVPLTPSTHHLVGRDAFSRMSHGAYVINLSRGAVVDTSALVEAVTSGQLSGAFLDVFDVEPLPEDHRLWSVPGITVSPHMAGMTRGEPLAEQFLANYERFQRHEALAGVVDRSRGY